MDDRAIGFYGLTADRDGTSVLDALFVDPPYIGRGVGAVLFRRACWRAVAGGSLQLLLAADPHAEGFYRKQGAVVVGRVDSLPAGRQLPLMAVRLR